MTKAEVLYQEVGRKIKGAEESQMFGKPCFKLKGKAFVCFFKDCMVFKLTGKDHAEALGLKKSELFDPSGKGRAMKEWVQVTFEHSDQWQKFSKAAMEYVNGTA